MVALSLERNVIVCHLWLFWRCNSFVGINIQESIATKGYYTGRRSQWGNGQHTKFRLLDKVFAVDASLPNVTLVHDILKHLGYLFPERLGWGKVHQNSSWMALLNFILCFALIIVLMTPKAQRL